MGQSIEHKNLESKYGFTDKPHFDSIPFTCIMTDNPQKAHTDAVSTADAFPEISDAFMIPLVISIKPLTAVFTVSIALGVRLRNDDIKPALCERIPESVLKNKT